MHCCQFVSGFLNMLAHHKCRKKFLLLWVCPFSLLLAAWKHSLYCKWLKWRGKYNTPIMSIFLFQEKLTYKLGSSSKHSKKKQVLVCLIAKYIYNIPADQYINSVLVFYYQWRSQDITYAKAQHRYTMLIRTSALSAEAFRRVWGHPAPENLGILQPPRSVLRS